MKSDMRGLREQHGKRGTPTPEYISWFNMKTRCLNPNSDRFPFYGGRGITVCKRWATSFSAFLADMGPKPKSSYTIDRKDNNGNYEPGNCMWISRESQARNRRSSHIIKFQGKQKTVAEWGQITGISTATILARLRNGWSVRQALTLPLQKQSHGKLASHKREAIALRQQGYTVKMVAKKYGVTTTSVYCLLPGGWSSGKDAIKG